MLDISLAFTYTNPSHPSSNNTQTESRFTNFWSCHRTELTFTAILSHEAVRGKIQLFAIVAEFGVF